MSARKPRARPSLEGEPGDVLPRWLVPMLACPRCGKALAAARSLIRCSACGPYPLLGDVPVLVSNPADYCRGFHDSILAALAEHGLATREAVAVVEAFAEGSDVEPRRFGDDWTPHERTGDAPPQPVEGPAESVLERLLRAGREEGPATWLARHSAKAQRVAEIGCGAGERSQALARVAKHLVVADLSLRAVLGARARAAQGDAEVAAVVAEAEALPFTTGAFDTVVAENVVDLLDAPLDFLVRVRGSLSPGGRALVTTPAPALGGDDDGVLAELAKRAGLKVGEVRDGLPWLRVNSTRHVETYLVQALALVR